MKLLEEHTLKKTAKRRKSRRTRKETMANKIKLSYFPIQGVAEKVRLAFVLKGIEFEDDRIPFDVFGSTVKATTKYGQLPLLTLENGQVISQSDAMLRYIASLPGKVQLMPTDPISQLKVNEVIGLSADFEREWVPCLYMAMMPEKFGYDPEYKKSEEGKEAVKKLRENFLSTSFPRFLKYFEDFINESNDAFLCGPEITIADCVVVPQLVRYTLGFIDYVPKDSLEKTNPKVAAYVNRFLAIPEVKEWYDSSKK